MSVSATAGLPGDAAEVPAETAAERLRAARRSLTDAAREASPEAAGLLGGAALAISAHEAVIGAIEEVAPAPLGFGAQAAVEASAMLWVAAAGAQAACLANVVSGPSAGEARASAALAQ